VAAGSVLSAGVGWDTVLLIVGAALLVVGAGWTGAALRQVRQPTTVDAYNPGRGAPNKFLTLLPAMVLIDVGILAIVAGVLL